MPSVRVRTVRIKQENIKQNSVFSTELCKGTNFQVCGPLSINLSAQKKNFPCEEESFASMFWISEFGCFWYSEEILSRPDCSILSLFAQTVLVPEWVNPESINGKLSLKTLHPFKDLTGLLSLL